MSMLSTILPSASDKSFATSGREVHFSLDISFLFASLLGTHSKGTHTYSKAPRTQGPYHTLLPTFHVTVEHVFEIPLSCSTCLTTSTPNHNTSFPNTPLPSYLIRAFRICSLAEYAVFAIVLPSLQNTYRQLNDFCRILSMSCWRRIFF
jgi:hypothetical protein